MDVPIALTEEQKAQARIDFARSGGNARAAKLSKERREQIARKAGKANKVRLAKIRAAKQAEGE